MVIFFEPINCQGHNYQPKPKMEKPQLEAEIQRTNADIQETQNRIKKVEKQIDDNSARLERGDLDLSDKAFFQNKELQLRNELSQLRNKESQLKNELMQLRNKESCKQSCFVI
jgi:predicted  nucleic acid-binding Zn-ribbon protein